MSGRAAPTARRTSRDGNHKLTDSTKGRAVPTLDRDGVKLAYDDAGGGGPPLLLLHGWAADRSYFVRQFEHFAAKHRVIGVDLRGHGASDKPGQAYTIEGFADDAAWICGELGVVRPVLVGHSMGGSVALAMAARHLELQTAAVVLFEALVVAPPPLVEQFKPVLEALRTDAYQHVMRHFMDQLFGPHFDPDDKARRLDQMKANPQKAMVSALESVLAYDSTAAAAGCKMPILYVSSGPWYTDVSRFRELCPQLVTGQTVGGGHYFPLEIPEQVNPMVERFLKISQTLSVAPWP